MPTPGAGTRQPIKYHVTYTLLRYGELKGPYSGIYTYPVSSITTEAEIVDLQAQIKDYLNTKPWNQGSGEISDVFVLTWTKLWG
ncbi:hypothetical protein EVC30_081 [Rhizobium phage RHph_Y1_11]|nr:hypothetical protein EVC30_081 [Rhizobium phage RHph_Y1_11]